MPGRSRTEYRLALPAPPPPRRTGACVGLKVRRPSLEQAPVLGELLLAAYKGTPDDEGETLEQAQAVARGFFVGGPHRPLLEASSVAWRGEQPVGLCFIGWWKERECPFVQFIATRPEAKGTGVGRLLLGESLRRLSRDGQQEVRAVITDTNEPSKAIFARYGFQVAGPRPVRATS